MQSERSHDELLETCVQAAMTYTDGYHIEVCEEPTIEPGETHIPAEDEDFTEVRKEHLDTMQADGSKKSRRTTRGLEQTLDGTENHVAGTVPHLKTLLVDAAVRGCKAEFYKALATEEHYIYLEPPPEAEVERGKDSLVDDILGDMSSTTFKDQKHFKKLARYLTGTRDGRPEEVDGALHLQTLREEAGAACTPQGRPAAWHRRAEQRYVEPDLQGPEAPQEVGEVPDRYERRGVALGILRTTS